MGKAIRNMQTRNRKGLATYTKGKRFSKGLTPASRKSLNAGFTLMELIVVMAILTVLVLIAAPKFISHTAEANATAMAADAKVISQALMQAQIKGVDMAKVISGTNPVADSEAHKAATAAGIAAATGTVTANTDLKQFIEIGTNDLSQFLKNTRNNIEDYYVVVTDDGLHPLEGEVFYKTTISIDDKEWANGVYRFDTVPPKVTP